MSLNSSIDVLVNHSRKITQELNQLAFGFTEELREIANQKVQYAEKLSESLSTKAFKATNSNENSKSIDNFFILMISSKPKLDNAISALKETLTSKPKEKIEENLLSIEEIESKLLESFNKLMAEENGEKENLL